MEIKYKDNLNIIKKEVVIDEDLVSEFFTAKGIPSDLSAFYSVSAFENDEDFEKWYEEVYIINPYYADLSAEIREATYNILKGYIERKGWENPLKILSEVVVCVKFNSHFKYSLDWNEVKKSFINNYLNVMFVGDPAHYYNKRLQNWAKE